MDGSACAAGTMAENHPPTLRGSGQNVTGKAPHSRQHSDEAILLTHHTSHITPSALCVPRPAHPRIINLQVQAVAERSADFHTHINATHAASPPTQTVDYKHMKNKIGLGIMKCKVTRPRRRAPKTISADMPLQPSCLAAAVRAVAHGALQRLHLGL